MIAGVVLYALIESALLQKVEGDLSTHGNSMRGSFIAHSFLGLSDGSWNKA